MGFANIIRMPSDTSITCDHMGDAKWANVQVIEYPSSPPLDL